MSTEDNRRFSSERYSGLIERTFEKVRELGRLKGGEYSGDDDRLANFRRNAKDLGLPYEAIWRVYAAKHWDAVGQYIRDIVNGTTRERMEGLDGRVDDLIVYLLLFKAMLEEKNEGRLWREKEDTIGELKAKAARVLGDEHAGRLFKPGPGPNPDNYGGRTGPLKS